MRRLLQSKAGMAAVCLVALIMAFMLHRIATRARERMPTGQDMRSGSEVHKASPESPARGGKQEVEEAMAGKSQQSPTPSDGNAARARTLPSATPGTTHATVPGTTLQEDLSFMDQGRALGSQSRKDRDRQGRTQIRRRTAGGVGEGQSVAEVREKKAGSLQLRLAGKPRKGERSPAGNRGEETGGRELSDGEADGAEQHPGDGPAARDGDTGGRGRGDAAGPRRMETEIGSGLLNTNTPGGDGATERFCPYGRPIRCELVFTVDSTMEETPLVALVMEPVYNNGQLVIPAGAELHGMARPDRLRDRIFSSSEWVLLFPREEGLPNGRELRVRGLALDRAEPATDGLSWGITDGSNGLQGTVIRTLESEDLKRFAAGFISAAALGLQERETAGRNGSRSSNTPGNAALQGVAATMEDMARRISTEIERHGVFLRVPGGKQFYFYPQQAIHPWRAAVPRPADRTPEGG